MPKSNSSGPSEALEADLVISQKSQYKPQCSYFYAILFFMQEPFEKFQCFWFFISRKVKHDDKQAKLPLIRTGATTQNTDPIPGHKWQNHGFYQGNETINR